jgi:heme/copper-type cytochrome/quinol oxidase subunit 2
MMNDTIDNNTFFVAVILLGIVGAFLVSCIWRMGSSRNRDRGQWRP